MRTAQDGEDRLLARWLRRIGAANHVAVEFGAGDGRTNRNTARLEAHGWRVVLFDRAPADPSVIDAQITRDNINALFTAHGIPPDLDVLSIDVDGNDLWLWQALTFRPRIVVIEYNPKWPPEASVTVPYDEARVWDSTDYYGASVGALCRLGRRKGYRLVRWTYSNLLFIRKDLIRAGLPPWRVNVPRQTKRPDPQARPWVVYR